MIEKKKKPFEKRLWKKLFFPLIISLFMPLFSLLYFANSQFNAFNKSVEMIDRSEDSIDPVDEIKLVGVRFKNNLIQLTIIHTIGILFLSFVVLIFWYFKILHPINLLILIAKDIAKGRKETPIKLNTRDELYGLSYFLEKYSLNFQSLETYREKNQSLYRSLGFLITKLDRFKGVIKEKRDIDKEAFIALLTDQIENIIKDFSEAMEENRNLGLKLTEITIQFSKKIGEIATRVEKEGIILKDFQAVINDHTQSVENFLNSAKKRVATILEEKKSNHKLAEDIFSRINYFNKKNYFAGKEAVYNDIENHLDKILNLKGVAVDLSSKINILSLNSTILSTQMGENGKEILKVSQEIARIAEKYPLLMDELLASVNGIKKSQKIIINNGSELLDDLKENQVNSAQISQTTEKLAELVDSTYKLEEETLNTLNEQISSYTSIAKNISSLFLNSKEKDQLMRDTEQKIRLLSQTYKEFYDVLRTIYGPQPPY